MALSCKVGSFTVPASTGNKATTGVGFQPKVVLFFGNRMSADGATTTAAAFTPFFGVGVSSSSRVVITEADDFVSITDTAADTTKCLKHITGSTTSFAADLVSLDADGFTVNFTTANATAYVVNYIALGGSDLTNVALTSFTTPTTTGNRSYTGVGFQPDAALLLSGTNGTLDSWTIGFATSTTKRGVNTTGYNGGAAAGLYQRTDKVYANPASSAVQTQADLVSFDSDGLTLNWDTANAATHTVYVLSLKGGRFSVGSFLQKTSTGSQATTGVGFTPTGLFFLSRGLAAATTISSDGLGVMMGAASGASARGVVLYSSAVLVAGELSRSAVFTNRNDDSTPTLNAKADLTSFDADGFTLNYSTADAVAREVLYFAFGSTGGGAVTEGFPKGRRQLRPAPFTPMGDPFRTGKYVSWR